MDLFPNEILNLSQFIFGGKAEFTIENIQSGKGYQYRVNKAENKNSTDKRDRYFVRVKDGSSEVYAGMITVYPNGAPYYNQGKTGAYDKDSPPIKGLFLAIYKATGGMKRPMVLYHHGKCSRCGRKLTDPESIERGIGPECIKKI